MDKENKVNHSGYEIEDVGQVQIADEVIAVIAGLAATEVDGVQQMSGNITNEIVSKLGMKNLSKGVKVSIDGEQVDVDLNLILQYGVSIPKTSKEVQEKVKGAIETMTGLTVNEVNIRIAGIQTESE
ncbi:MAG TPA: Asp23/Gls24 family envelope stress response protein [Candidatus Anaerobutyricum stercoris]|mgnify:FL=1|uniref:Asp23/Gls24 family envelope stress response protein n=1 Tax=Candidatus Anaerobutyricum stercoris TaxID=2838457 RepID=A0A9D2J7L1_9FIRM|nr:Asp23/Gls24 family envelope stress response protein [Eubacterium sp. An3]OUO28300.1 Asp23/Gls24 family envelope stress response protein [Eubacterium sp. An3]CVI69774.1 Alkaline shock protein 23 [Eubacteriaceae bacterium CHKCI004]HIZ39621.1 Asp23/Gls24 family envelope stress response protein [Candidatus Anaerobutyricum stercoris]